jgi:hypothetical protein
MAEDKLIFDEQEESLDLSSPDVLEKYKAAAGVANRINVNL